ncbi:unnamed protein product, partial [marine sediment metagenome]
KKVGDHNYGWNPRKAWIRVYDPRGFEFEITVANLVFILEETSAIKGKGLEGEFVYAWDRSDLVLLPVSSQEYKQCSEFTELQTKKITKEEMTEGCVYVNKQNEKVLYLGRHDFYRWKFDWKSHDGESIWINKHQKCHVFVKYLEGGETEYWTQKGFTQLASKVSSEVSSDFAGEYDKFKKGSNGCSTKKFTFKKTKGTLKKLKSKSNYYGDASTIVKHEDKWYRVGITSN